MRRYGLPAVLVAALMASLAPGPAVHASHNPVVLVHGFALGSCPSSDGQAHWGDLVAAYRAWGWTGPLQRVGYYGCDVNQDHDISHHGSHARHYGGSGSHDAQGRHTNDTPIEHLAYHWAWYVYDHYARDGVAVDAIGHSMGGLIVRYALAQVQARHPDFPPALYAYDVVTFGTPHSGTGWAYFCFSTQCVEMRPGSAFMDWLAQYAPNPQGTYGTDWTAIGSEDDGIVSESSAIAMDADHKVVYLGGQGIGHNDFMHLTSTQWTAAASYWDRPGPWYTGYALPWPVRWSFYALLYDTW